MSEERRWRAEERAEFAEAVRQAVSAQLTKALVERDEERFRVLAFLHRHTILATLDRPAPVNTPITMQDVRLMAGEGKLSGADVLAACNAILRQRGAAPPAPVGEDEVGRALYEQWVAENSEDDWVGWNHLPDKETWRARARAAIAAMQGMG